MKVLVAMSGGVDSSVAAALLIEQGHEVVGATLKLWGGVSDSGCCSVSDVDDARRVAQVLGIDHHVFNYTEEFEKMVVAPFVEGHAAGDSPNPCIDCNRHIKFDLLFERADRLGFDAVATGHHAQVVSKDGHYFLARGADNAKDQSYVLGYLREPELARLILPIGHMNKSAVRAEAERLGLRTWNKPDSQDVCFIESVRGREAFLRERIPVTAAAIVDAASGEVLGETNAAELMTVGQRRGITPSKDGEKRYVTRVDLSKKVVTVGRLVDIMTTEVILDEQTLTFAREALIDGQTVLSQWSAHGKSNKGTLRFDGRWKVVLSEPARPVAAGQTIVFYNPDEPELVQGAAIVSR